MHAQPISTLTNYNFFPRMMSGAGIIVILFFGFIFSAHPGHVKWRHVVWGIGIEFVFGLLVLRWEVRTSQENLLSCLIVNVFVLADWQTSVSMPWG